MLILWLPSLMRRLSADRHLWTNIAQPNVLFFLDSTRAGVFSPAPDLFAPFADTAKACRDFQEIIQQAEASNRVSWHKGSSFRRHGDFLKFARLHSAPFDEVTYCTALRARYGHMSNERLLIEAFFINGYEGSVSMIFKLWPGLEIIF